MAKKRGLDFKALMLAHVEKIAVGVIAVCFAVLLWAAFSREGVPPGIEPADIQDIVVQANGNIRRTTWEDFNDKPQMRNFSQESGWYDVPTDPYQLTVEWNPDVFPKQKLRDDPKYYPVQDLEAHYDQGPLALLTGEAIRAMQGRNNAAIPADVEKIISEAQPRPAGKAPVAAEPNRIVEGAPSGPIKVELPGVEVDDNEVAEGRRWIMVNALVPWQDQIDAYTDSFREAAGFDQKNDIPQYLGYEVERADVTGGVTPVWKPHQKISERALNLVMLRWAKAKRTELIAKPYRHSVFTSPLPPRVLDLWGNRDKHSKVPLESNSTQDAAAVAAPMPVANDPLAGGDEEGMAEEALEETDAKSANSNTLVHKMLRYFDFDVQPGHAYQYRFRAALRDPNYVRDSTDGAVRGVRRVELKLLNEIVVKRINEKRASLEQDGLPADAVERMMPVAYTDWSDPSPVVKVPPDLYVLALRAEQPPEGRFNLEPATSLMVTRYDSALGAEVGGETKLQRGNLANFTASGVQVINVNHSTLEARDIAFATDYLMLDIRGGTTAGPATVSTPTETLMLDMDHGARLIVADEVEDAISVSGYLQRKAKIDALAPKTESKSTQPTGPLDTDIINP